MTSSILSEIDWPLAGKVLSLSEAYFDLISGSSLSMKIQIMGGKITENLWFKPPLRKVKIFLFFFLLIFKFLAQKWMSFILATFWYLVQLLRNKKCSFYGEFENGKKKGQKVFDLPERRFKPLIFSNFLTHDMNFHVKWKARVQIKKSF